MLKTGISDPGKVADYFKEYSARPCMLKTGISDPGKVACLTKLFICFGGEASQGGFIFDFSDARLPWFIITSSFHFSCPVGRSIFLFRNIVPEGIVVKHMGFPRSNF